MNYSAITLFGIVTGLSAGSYFMLNSTNSLAPKLTSVQSDFVSKQKTSSNGSKSVTAELNNEVKSELSVLRQELTRLKSEMSKLQQNSVATQGSEGSFGQASRDDAETLAENEAIRHQHMEAVETEFQQELPDQDWADDVQNHLHATFATDEIVQSALLSAECRSHTCRVELAHDETGQLDKMLPMIVQQLGEKLPSVTANYIYDGDELQSIILYMSDGTGEII